jgi:hypothetical protein
MFKYALFNNNFHNGSKIQNCKTLRSAVKARHRLEPKGCQGGDCKCGGIQIKKTDGECLTFEEYDTILDIEYYEYNN